VAGLTVDINDEKLYYYTDEVAAKKADALLKAWKNFYAEALKRRQSKYSTGMESEANYPADKKAAEEEASKRAADLQGL
jgi:hypothetical protein